MKKPPKNSPSAPVTLTPSVMDMRLLARLPRNAKEHDTAAIEASMETFGYLQRLVVNTTTGHLLSGHGRLEVLRSMQQLGKTRPDGIGGTGPVWLVPVDSVSVAEDREEAVALALNKVQERGGWEDTILNEVLHDLAAANALGGTGFTLEDLDALDGAATLSSVPLPPPKMAWVLIGIPLPHYPTIAAHIETLAALEGVLLETTFGN